MFKINKWNIIHKKKKSVKDRKLSPASDQYTSVSFCFNRSYVFYSFMHKELPEDDVLRSKHVAANHT
jgi:hypothetical protein